MSGSDAGEVEFSLKVMMDEKKTKVLFAEAGSEFVDILLSFLTLPLGRIVKVLEKKYGDEAPAIGSLSTLYRSLSNLDSSHFWTEGAKETLLDPISIFDAECERLKLDIVDSPPAEYFCCSEHPDEKFRSVSMYYDSTKYSQNPFCDIEMNKEIVGKRSEAASGDGVFTMRRASFIISDDLQIFPRETRFLQMISTLGITDRDNHETIKVDFGSSEIMYLLKASLTSPTPLSDLILNKTVRLNSVVVEPQLMTAEEYNPSCNSLTLNVIIQRSTGKLLYAQAKKDFIEFLLSLLSIPLGEVEHLLGGKTCLKAINNLYRSTADVIDDEYFKSPDAKTRLMKPNVAHGCISENHILPLTEEPLPATYKYFKNSSSSKFPKGQGSYLQGLQTYMVSDDLTVVPYCFTSMLASLREQKIAISDVEDVELEIGLKEGLSILRASLASTRALTDALLTQISNNEGTITGTITINITPRNSHLFA